MKAVTNKSAALVLAYASVVASMFGGYAQAQSSVDVYGLVGVYVGSVKRSGEKAAVLTEGGGGLKTSYLGFRGQEELGGGLKAIFSLESFLRPDTGEQGRKAGDPFFSRNAWVGVRSDLGRLTFGRQTNPTYSVMSRLSPLGNSVVFSPLALHTFVASYGGAVLGDSIWNNTIQYRSPDINGFTGAAIYGLGEQADQAGVANLGLHGTYRNGKFMAALSAQRLRMNVAVPLAVQQNTYLAGANYDFGIVKLFANAVRTNIDGGIGTRTVDLGVSVPVSKSSALLAEVARTKEAKSGIHYTRRTTATIGYNFRMSKRTDLYAMYVFDKKTNAASAGSAALGIRHLF